MCQSPLWDSEFEKIRKQTRKEQAFPGFFRTGDDWRETRYAGTGSWRQLSSSDSLTIPVYHSGKE